MLEVGGGCVGGVYSRGGVGSPAVGGGISKLGVRDGGVRQRKIEGVEMGFGIRFSMMSRTLFKRGVYPTEHLPFQFEEPW